MESTGYWNSHTVNRRNSFGRSRVKNHPNQSYDYPCDEGTEDRQG